MYGYHRPIATNRIRDFGGIYKFRKHLNKEHTTSNVTLNLNPNEITNENSEIDPISAESILLNSRSSSCHTEYENNINI